MSTQDTEVQGRRVQGGCLCGAVRFEFDGPVPALECCHCRRCRKATGSAFLPSLHVARDCFRFLSGEETIRTMDLPVVDRPPPYRHAFCTICGSPAPFIHPATRAVAIPAGALDDEPDAETIRHIYVEHEAAWHLQAMSASRLTSTQIRELRRAGKGPT